MDDAVTPVDGKPSALWRCPKCGHRFVTRNLWHSCGRFRISDHFRGKPSAIRQLFRRFVILARGLGPVTVYAQKTRIVVQARVRFAGTVPRQGWLDVGLWLRRRVSHPLLHRVENFGELGFGHHFKIESSDDFDAAFVDLLRESYEAAIQVPPRATRKGDAWP